VMRAGNDRFSLRVPPGRHAVAAFAVALLLASVPGVARAAAPQLKLLIDRAPAGAPLHVKVFVVSRRVPLGAYTLELAFDAARLEVAAIKGGDVKEFTAPPIANAGQFQTGSVRFSAFQAQRLDGPTGRVLIAELTLQPRALPAGVKRARVRVELRPITVTDTKGKAYRVQKRVKIVMLRAF
jgi:hypothetical protein